MSHLLEDFQNFLTHSPTSLHAVKECCNRLAALDFIPLDEKESWDLLPGKSYFVQRGGSFAAWVMPEKKIVSAKILAAHTDSPSLKLKMAPLFVKEGMLLARVEPYGSPLLSSWLGKDLAIAGRVVLESGAEKLLFLDTLPIFIPQLAIHLDREVNEKGLLLNKQDHLCPLIGLSKETSLETLLKPWIGSSKLLAADLFLVPLETPRLCGLKDAFLASYRLDNLTSVHAALSALLTNTKASTDLLKMIYNADHEEIGSCSTEGASSPFLSDLLDRITLKAGLSLEETFMFKRSSYFVSIDMAHALHPNYTEKHDPQHLSLLGHGVVFKSSAQHKYASTATTLAPLISLCQKHALPFQLFSSRSDLPSGSTIGPIVAEKTGIPTVDIGCPQLSMHATRELIAVSDYLTLCNLLQRLYDT